MEFLVELITEFICSIFESIIDDKKVSLIVRLSLYSILFLMVIAATVLVLVTMCKKGDIVGIVVISVILIFFIAIGIYALSAFIEEDKKK